MDADRRSVVEYNLIIRKSGRLFWQDI
jgi:hypothetical protein